MNIGPGVLISATPMSIYGCVCVLNKNDWFGSSTRGQREGSRKKLEQKGWTISLKQGFSIFCRIIDFLVSEADIFFK